MNYKQLQEVFYDTIKIAYTKETIVYKEEDLLTNNIPIKIIWSENTVKTIFELPSNSIAALNFADPFTPGGLVWDGVQTQEEDLCRSSTLYNSLINNQNQQNFYYYNRIKNSSTDRFIYSKDVLFFKDENCSLVTQPKWCDVITCSAPLPNEVFSLIDLKKRMRRIIDSAAIHNKEYLILGKWGCGAYGGDWQLYYQLWKEVIQERKININFKSI